MYLENILIISLIIFLVGCWGLFVNRRNIIILLMSLEIMYLAANLNFAFYTFLSDDIIGVIFIIYILTIVGVESCIGLSLISVYYIVHRDISINTMDLLRR
jgi:NADH-quinone oxidoreductase subunit K